MHKICHHPLIDTKLSLMRDRATPSAVFRECLEEITSLMSFYVFENVQVTERSTYLTTPTGAQLHPVKLKDEVMFVPVLRAGLGMLSPMLKLVPTAEVGYLALARNEETLEAIKYYEKIPALENPLVIVLDPMLATGGSLMQTVDLLKKNGYQRIKVVSVIAAPEGLKRLEDAHPDIEIYIGVLDEKLNEFGFIVPGLGDAGDRLYGFPEEK